MYRHVHITLRIKLWEAWASLMLGVTIISFTGTFTILIVVNLLRPAAAAAAWSSERDAAGHCSPRRLMARTRRSARCRLVYLIDQERRNSRKNAHPHHMIRVSAAVIWRSRFYTSRKAKASSKAVLQSDPQWVMFPKEPKPIDFPLPSPLKQGYTCRGKRVVHLLPWIKFAAVYRLVVLHIWKAQVHVRGAKISLLLLKWSARKFSSVRQMKTKQKQ